MARRICPYMDQKRITFFYAALANVVLIVYGSLVPFDIRYKTLAEAWEFFRHIPYLQLGVDSRADWVANIVLYVPFAFFASAWLAHGEGLFSRRAVRTVLVVAAGVALAVAVEFTQIWFAPRTVSLNDIIAEGIGTVIGIVIWDMAGQRLIALARKIFAGGPPAVQAVAAFYVLGYIAFSLFPYDFIVSAKELAWKLGTGRAHLILAECGGSFVCLAKLAAEVLAVAPLGVWLGMLSGQDRRRTLRVALYVGLGLGVVVEVTQFFLASGVSQGISVLTRGAGVLLGAVAYQNITWHRINRVARYFRPMIIVGAAPYAVALMTVNGWFSGPWLGLQDAVARLAQVNFLPFYYHYYSTETAALQSAVRQIGMYLPLGVAYLAWSWGAAQRNVARRAWVAAALGAGAAFIISVGKLFVAAKHPDPTDILIAAGAAAMGYLLMVWIMRWSSETTAAEPEMQPAQRTDSVETFAPVGEGRVSFLRRLVSGLIFGIAIAVAVRYPVHAAWLDIALFVYALLLWRSPSLWLLVLPALLPVLDFSPWTGWFFFDEFDLFVMVTLAVGLWRSPAQAPAPVMSRLVVVLLGLLAASFAVSLAIGVLPLSPLDANAFFSYMSHYNALRVAKGFVWALALLPLLRREAHREDGRFVTGMVLGLTGIVAALLWERYLYPGLVDFHSDYRISATFFSMHTGGPQIEAYLIFAMPFAIAWSLARRTAWSAVATLALFAGGTYGVLVTYSRGGYLALVVMLVILAGGLLMRAGQRQAVILRRAAAVVVVLLMTAVIAFPVLQGGYAESRFQQLGVGLEERIHHWRSTLAMMDEGPFSTLFGMGLGRFPETYLNKNKRDVLPGNFRFIEEEGNTYLRLGAKDSLFMGQRVAVEDHHPYVLSLDMRSDKDIATLDVSLCEKYLLYSMNCRRAQVKTQDDTPGWRHYQIPIAAGEIGEPVHGFRRSVELAFSNPLPDTLVDIDNVRFVDEQGRGLLSNGDFSQGHDRWFFTVDDDWPWRVENVWLQLFFEQGMVGVIAFTLLVAYALVRVMKEIRLGRSGASLVLASVLGFLTVGLFGSVLESPRLMLLFYWVLFMVVSTARAGMPWLLQAAKRDPRRVGG